MAHMLFRVGVKRTQSIPHILMQTAPFRFGSSAANKVIYSETGAMGGNAEGSDEGS